MMRINDIVTCALYPAATFVDTKSAISGIPPRMADVLDAPLDLMLSGALLFNCM
jgi:hypothetical protein